MANRLYIFKNTTSESTVSTKFDITEGLYVPKPNVTIDGSIIRAEIDKFEYVDQFMGERYVTFTLDGAYVSQLSIGDWCYINGEILRLYYKPTPKKIASSGSYGGAFTYENVKMQSIAYELAKVYAMDYSYGDTDDYYCGIGSFSLYVETLWDLAYKIYANLEVHYAGEWVVQVLEEGEEYTSQSVSVSEETTLLALLANANSKFNQNYYIETKHEGDDIVPGNLATALVTAGVIRAKTSGGYELAKTMKVVTIGGIVEDMPSVLSYGKGNGVRNVEVGTESNSTMITRLMAFGNNRNMPYRYYNRRYKKRYPNGVPKYPVFWSLGASASEDNEYLLDSAHNYYPNLMLPVDYWNKVTVGTRVQFNVFIDAIYDNFDTAYEIYQALGNDYMTAWIKDKRDKAPDDIEDIGIYEGQRKFDKDDGKYEDVYPSIEKAVVDSSWEGLEVYESGYETPEVLLGKIMAEYVIRDMLEKAMIASIDKAMAATVSPTEDYEYTYSATEGKCSISITFESYNQTAKQYGSPWWVFALFGSVEKNEDDEYVVMFNERNARMKELLFGEKKIADDILVRRTSAATQNLSKNEDGLLETLNVSSSTSFADEYTFQLRQDVTIMGQPSLTPKELHAGAYTFRVYVTMSLADMSFINSKLCLAYAQKNDAGEWYYEESPQYTKTLTEDDVDEIKENTVDGLGRLDVVTSRSIKTYSMTTTSEGVPISDNGISEDGEYEGSLDTEGNEIEGTFEVTIPQIGFDILDWVNESPVIAFKSGKCAGMQFEIIDCYQIPGKTYNGGWILTLNRFQDTTLNMLYPNKYNMIEEGDEYVLLGINMPDIYVDMAERKLVKNAMKYLGNSNEIAHRYTVELDNKWLKENYASYTKHLKSGKMFLFEDADIIGDDEASIAIKHLTIRFGNAIIPEYEIQLDTNVTAQTIQLTISNEVKNANRSLEESVSRIRKQISGGRGVYEYSEQSGYAYEAEHAQEATYAAKADDVSEGVWSRITSAIIDAIDALKTWVSGKFLSKEHDDSTEHKITLGELEVDGNAQFNTGATFGDYSAGIVGGSGGNIDSDGNAEFDSLIVRETMTVADLCFNRASVVSGSMFEGPCKGKIKSVTQLTATTGKATLELGADDIAGSIMEGDYCWGYWHNISGGNATADSDDLNGSITYKGFTTVYFHIDEVLNSNSTEFTYTLKPNTTAHPFVGMNFGGRGSNKYANRQAFRFSTPSYVAQYAMVSSWNWDNEQHCVRVSGVLDGFESLVGEEENTWNNKIGTIEGNAYIKGNLVQVTSNKRYLYVTQKNNGVIQPESGDTLELVVRDGWFQDRTGEFEFVLTVNGEEIGTIERHAESHTFVIEAGADYLSYDNTTIHIEATDEDGTYVVEQDVTEQRIVSQYRLATYKGAVNPGELVEGSFAFDDGSEVLWDDAQAIAEVTAGDTVSCVRKYGNVHTEIGYLYYSLNNGDLEEYIEGAAVDVDTDTTLVTFWWYYDEEQEQFIDKIDVAVVSNGVDGEDGKDAIDIKIFTDTGNLRIEKGGTITLTAYVYKGGEDITDTIQGSFFSWTRVSDDTTGDIVWNQQHSGVGNTITIGDDDLYRSAMFECIVQNINN